MVIPGIRSNKIRPSAIFCCTLFTGIITLLPMYLSSRYNPSTRPEKIANEDCIRGRATGKFKPASNP